MVCGSNNASIPCNAQVLVWDKSGRHSYGETMQYIPGGALKGRKVPQQMFPSDIVQGVRPFIYPYTAEGSSREGQGFFTAQRTNLGHLESSDPLPYAPMESFTCRVTPQLAVEKEGQANKVRVKSPDGSARHNSRSAAKWKRGLVDAVVDTIKQRRGITASSPRMEAACDTIFKSMDQAINRFLKNPSKQGKKCTLKKAKFKCLWQHTLN